MTVFAVSATLLIVLALAFLLPPLWRGGRTGNLADRKAANLAIFRDQLAELEREKVEGSLLEADFVQARAELQRRLIEEVDQVDAATLTQRVPSRKLAVALILLFPLVALLGYGIFGNLRALDPTQTTARPQMTPEQINAMVGKLAERMRANPDDMQGWLMLARSYKTLGRYAEAAEAYGKAEKVIDDPDQLASYAEVLAMAGNKGLKGKPRQLVDKALKIDPNNGHSLFLAGAAAMEAGDNAQGIAYWQKLLPMVEPGSDVEKMLQDGIAKMQSQLKAGNKPAKK
jgi:cytochrome c-type biogenesis protein CcmH